LAELLEATSAQLRAIIDLPESTIKLGPLFSVIETGSVLDIGESADPYITLESAAGKSVIIKKVLDMNSANKIINLVDPTADQDAATRKFVLDQILTVGGPAFADDVFRINDNVDPTKQIAFQASAITTATIRTIAMPDADIQLVNTPDGLILDANIGVHDSTKISILNKSQLNTAIVFNDQANIFGDFTQTFQDNRLLIQNPAGDFVYTFVAAAIGVDVNLNLPQLTTSDTFDKRNCKKNC